MEKEKESLGKGVLQHTGREVFLAERGHLEKL